MIAINANRLLVNKLYHIDLNNLRMTDLISMFAIEKHEYHIEWFTMTHVNKDATTETHHFFMHMFRGNKTNWQINKTDFLPKKINKNKHCLF